MDYQSEYKDLYKDHYNYNESDKTEEYNIEINDYLKRKIIMKEIYGNQKMHI